MRMNILILRSNGHGILDIIYYFPCETGHWNSYISDNKANFFELALYQIHKPCINKIESKARILSYVKSRPLHTSYMERRKPYQHLFSEHFSTMRLLLGSQ